MLQLEFGESKPEESQSEQSKTEARKAASCSSETLKSNAGSGPAAAGCPVSNPDNLWKSPLLQRSFWSTRFDATQTNGPQLTLSSPQCPTGQLRTPNVTVLGLPQRWRHQSLICACESSWHFGARWEGGGEGFAPKDKRCMVVVELFLASPLRDCSRSLCSSPPGSSPSSYDDIAGGRRNSGTRSVLVGQTLLRLPSSVEHQASFVDLGNVLCKAVPFSEGDAVTYAVMASTVDHVRNDRGRKDAVDWVQASSAASLACSCPCKKKRRWRSMQTGPSIVYVAISWPARSSCRCCFSWRSLWWLLGSAAARAWWGRGRGSGGGAGGDLLQLPDSVWDRPGNYHLEGLTSDFTRAHPTGSPMPENCEPTWGGFLQLIFWSWKTWADGGIHQSLCRRPLW